MAEEFCTVLCADARSSHRFIPQGPGSAGLLFSHRVCREESLSGGSMQSFFITLLRKEVKWKYIMKTAAGESFKLSFILFETSNTELLLQSLTFLQTSCKQAMRQLLCTTWYSRNLKINYVILNLKKKQLTSNCLKYNKRQY